MSWPPWVCGEPIEVNDEGSNLHNDYAFESSRPYGFRLRGEETEPSGQRNDDRRGSDAKTDDSSMGSDS